MGKIDETENILELFLYAAGESEIPTSWIKWSGISAIAASLSDRVYYRKYAWKVLPPNMYIMLVGDSGLGKGGAMDFALQFIDPRMNLLYGSTTKQSLIDRMCGEAEEGEMSKSKVFIIQDELGEAVGSGQVADAFIKAMTGWYGATSGTIEENTRMHGRKVVSDPPCINWLSGTTNEWLRDAVDYKAMMSGFFGRVCTVPGKSDYDNRIYRPQIVRDYDQVVGYLKERFEELTYLNGEFQMLPAAEELDREWYENRPKPSQGMEPFWRREHALILKLAMILSVCDYMDLVIHPKHIIGAQELVREIRSYMPEVIEHAAKGGVTTAASRVQAKIYEHKLGINRTDLLRFMNRFGLKAMDLDTIITHLSQQDLVETSKRGQRTWYIRKSKPGILWGSVD